MEENIFFQCCRNAVTQPSGHVFHCGWHVADFGRDKEVVCEGVVQVGCLPRWLPLFFVFAKRVVIARAVVLDAARTNQCFLVHMCKQVLMRALRDAA